MYGFYENSDDDDKKDYKKTVVYFLATASLVVLLFLIIVYVNTKEKNDKKREAMRLEQERIEALEEEMHKKQLEDEALGIGQYGITSDELDFWDLYEDEESDVEEEPDNRTLSGNKYKKNSENEDKIAEEKDPMDDGHHIKAADRLGEFNWYEIIEVCNKNEYEIPEKVKVLDNRMTYRDGKVVSVIGVDVSKNQGTVDWAKVKEDDIDYAMVRAGSRDGASGQIKLDDNYILNMTGAKAADIPVGVYFCSQAIDEDEAIEEANFTIGTLLNYGATYPVACSIEWSRDDSRNNELTKEERTMCVKAYCDVISKFGYIPMIHASRDMIIAGLEMDVLKDYDIWLTDEYESEDGTDFPYEFDMWQYSNDGKVEGIDGVVNLSIRFMEEDE